MSDDYQLYDKERSSLLGNTLSNGEQYSTMDSSFVSPLLSVMNNTNTMHNKQLSIGIVHSKQNPKSLTSKRSKNDLRFPTALVLESSNNTTEYKYLSLRDLLSEIMQHIQPNKDNESENNKSKSIPSVGNLMYRDLRRLEFQFNPIGQPILLVRQHTVLISFDPLRCVVTFDKIFLLISDGSDRVIEIFNKYIESTDNDYKSFEYRAYDAIFSTVITIQNEEYDILNFQISKILNELKKVSIIPAEKQELFRTLKNKIIHMSSRIEGYKRMLCNLLEEDGDMALMNLNLLRDKPEFYNLPLSEEILNVHGDIELLLEGYVMDYTNLESKIESLRSQMFSTEELVLLRLDTSRNQLLSVDIMLSLSGFVLGCGNFIGAMFGMNLINYHEDDSHGFIIVVFLTVSSMVILFVTISFYFRFTGIFPKESLM